MLRAASIMILVGTVIGVMMPSERATVPPPPEPAHAEARPVRPQLQPLMPQPLVPQPAPAPVGFAHEIALPRSGDGHFYAYASVNGIPINFLVDTGAGGVALSRADAQRAGVQFSTLDFQVVGQGASGEVLGQPVLLQQLSLGGESATDQPAFVLAGSEQSLLGQDFLRRFASVTIKNDTMVLR